MQFFYKIIVSRKKYLKVILRGQITGLILYRTLFRTLFIIGLYIFRILFTTLFSASFSILFRTIYRTIELKFHTKRFISNSTSSFIFPNSLTRLSATVPIRLTGPTFSVPENHSKIKIPLTLSTEISKHSSLKIRNFSQPRWSIIIPSCRVRAIAAAAGAKQESLVHAGGGWKGGLGSCLGGGGGKRG